MNNLRGKTKNVKSNSRHMFHIKGQEQCALCKFTQVLKRPENNKIEWSSIERNIYF